MTVYVRLLLLLQFLRTPWHDLQYTPWDPTPTPNPPRKPIHENRRNAPNCRQKPKHPAPSISPRSTSTNRPNTDHGPPQGNSPRQKPRPYGGTKPPPSRWNAAAPTTLTRLRIRATVAALKPRTYPPIIHIPKANNTNRTRSEIYSNLKIKPDTAHWRLFALFIVNFEHIHSLF